MDPFVFDDGIFEDIVINSRESDGITAEFLRSGMRVHSVEQLFARGLPRCERLVRTLEQIHKIKALRHRLRYELSKVEKRLTSLSKIQNSFQIVQGLPNEILGQIFAFACYAKPSRKMNLSQPLIISRVCSHWREVALSTPELWERVSLNDLRVAIPIINRARSAPIDLILRPLDDDPDSRIVARVLHTHQHRLRTVDIFATCSHKSLEPLLDAMQCDSAPVLRHFKIRHISSTPGEPNAALRALEKLSSKEPPLLQTLHMIGFRIQWGGPLMAGGRLTDLHISFQPAPFLSQILDVFRTNPLLKYIHLESLYIQDSLAPIVRVMDDSSRVDLPHLQQLSLLSIDVNYQRLLTKVSFQESVVVNLSYAFSHLSAVKDSDTELEEVLGFKNIQVNPANTFPHLPALRRQNARRVYFSGAQCCLKYYRALSGDDISAQSPGKEEIEEFPSLQIATPETWASFTFPYLGQAFPLPDLHTLHLSYLAGEEERYGFPNPQFDEVFGRLNSLRTLILDRCQPDPLSYILHSLIFSGSSANPQTEMMSLSLPLLRDIKIIFDGYTIPQKVIDSIKQCALSRTRHNATHDSHLYCQEAHISNFRTLKLSTEKPRHGYNKLLRQRTLLRLAKLDEALSEVGGESKVFRAKDEDEDDVDIREWTWDGSENAEEPYNIPLPI